jgi:hypothetical protein
MIIDIINFKHRDKFDHLVDVFKKEVADTTINISNFSDHYENNVVKTYIENNIEKTYDIDFTKYVYDDSDWFAVKIYDRQTMSRVDPFSITTFPKTISMLETMDGIERASFYTVGPGSYVPEHSDNDIGREINSIPVYNCALTTHVTNGVTITVGGEIFGPLTEKHAICLNAHEHLHSANNNSNSHWMALILCIRRDAI